jgi:hypothetical protein
VIRRGFEALAHMAGADKAARLEGGIGGLHGVEPVERARLPSTSAAMRRGGR